MNNHLKLKFYYDHVLGTVYAEGESPFHKTITDDVIQRFVVPENLPLTAKIIDLGCGAGYFLDSMTSLGYTNLQGITLSSEDISTCCSKGHAVKRGDFNFLDDTNESVDMLFCRHSLEHSPFPYITLLEYNRVLRPNALLYVEVPSPNCDQSHETNKNHFSILGKNMWLSLLQRTGFSVTWYDYEFPVNFSDGRRDVMERYYIFVCRRQMPVDIK